MAYRLCPHCSSTTVIEDGYCGKCRYCTLPPVGAITAPLPTKDSVKPEVKATQLEAEIISLRKELEFARALRDWFKADPEREAVLRDLCKSISEKPETK